MEYSTLRSWGDEREQVKGLRRRTSEGGETQDSVRPREEVFSGGRSDQL